MRYFICALDKINLGIPAERTERIIPVSWTQTNIYETGELSFGAEFRGTQCAFISLPALFRQGDAAPHGLVMKSGGLSEGGEAQAGGRKTVLLAPKIDRDIEIPEDAVRQLPKVFDGAFSFLNGAYFEVGNAVDGQNLILIFNPQKLIEAYHD